MRGPRTALDGIRRRRGRLLVVPRVGTDSGAYAATHPEAHWTVVRSAGPVARAAPVIDRGGEVGALMAPFLDRTMPALGVLELPGGVVAGRAGWVVSADRVLLADTSWHGPDVRGRRRYLRHHGRTFRVRQVSGVVAALATFNSWTSYCHSLLEGVARLALLEAAGHDLRAIDRLVVSVPSPFMRSQLARLGFSGDRIIEPAEGEAVRADLLLAPTFPGTRRNYVPETTTWLRDRLGVRPDPAARTRRLYVPRLEVRRLLNLRELAPMLERYGFETVDPGSHPDPIRAFAEARSVVGVHGAGLVNLVWCAPGTGVLEVLTDAHPMPHYRTLADAQGLRYAGVAGCAEIPPAGVRIPPQRRDLRVDAGAFAAALETIIALETAPGVPGAS